MNPFTRFFLRPVPAALLTRRAWPIVLILITGIALSIVVFFLVNSLETERQIKDFEQIAIERIGHLASELEEAVVDKVYAIRGFCAASNSVVRQVFILFDTHLDQYVNTVQAFDCISRVTESSSAA